MPLRLATLLALAVALPTVAQQPPATSTVSGHVYCADTNAPARFASVTLEPAGDLDQSSGLAPANTHTVEVQTLPDGSFSIPHVAPGSYYVNVLQPGYIAPLAQLGVTSDDLHTPDTGLRKQIAATIPHVLVQAHLPASVNITLQRGAAVTGTVLYDDGSPAVGLKVSILTESKHKWAPLRASLLPHSSSTTTDDLGHYRFAGLPARQFLIQVDLAISSMDYNFSANGSISAYSGQNDSIALYSGDAFRPSTAAPFTLKPGEELPGEDLEVPLNKLHTVSGTLSSAQDGHTLNGGTITLLHADDKSELSSTQLTRTNSSFHFDFVPPGDYIVKVTAARDLAYEELSNAPGSVPPTYFRSTTLKTYDDAQQPLHVENDISDLSIAVPPAAPKKH